jgi:hypothetical protein
METLEIEEYGKHTGDEKEASSEVKNKRPG